MPWRKTRNGEAYKSFVASTIRQSKRSTQVYNGKMEKGSIELTMPT